jgi:hypothetical protein
MQNLREHRLSPICQSWNLRLEFCNFDCKLPTFGDFYPKSQEVVLTKEDSEPALDTYLLAVIKHGHSWSLTFSKKGRTTKPSI